MTSFNIYEYATQKQIDQFKPTFLYLKQHAITGKMYFGKTTSKDIEKYKGSGLLWTRHIAKHGIEHVENLWYCYFTDIENLVEFAIAFSTINNISNSDIFLNMIAENGLQGGSYGHTAESKAKMSEKAKGRITSPNAGTFQPGALYPESLRQKLSEPKSESHRAAMSIAQTGIKHTEERKRKNSERQKGKVLSEETKLKLSIKAKESWARRNNG